MKNFRLVVLPFSALLLFYFFFVNYLDLGESGISFNRFSGEISLQDGQGLHFTAPWVFVSTVSMQPIRVCVTSTGRDVACKLVQFDSSAYRDFVRVQGFRYWWWSNRISYNMGYDEEYRGMRDLMRGYAFSVDKYPFIKILSEFQPSP